MRRPELAEMNAFVTVAERCSFAKAALQLGISRSRLSETIREHQGTVDKYIGDAIMAFWGAPRPLADHAVTACRSALAMRDRLRAMQADWHRQGKPDIAALEPSWHHNYASLGFFTSPPEIPEPHYPSIKPELVELTTALHRLAHDESRRREYLADAAAYAGRFRLTPPQRTALLGLDTPALVTMGVHPLVAFLANMQVERQRKS